MKHKIQFTIFLLNIFLGYSMIFSVESTTNIAPAVEHSPPVDPTTTNNDSITEHSTVHQAQKPTVAPVATNNDSIAEHSTIKQAQKPTVATTPVVKPTVSNTNDEPVTYTINSPNTRHVDVDIRGGASYSGGYIGLSNDLLDIINNVGFSTGFSITGGASFVYKHLMLDTDIDYQRNSFTVSNRINTLSAEQAATDSATNAATNQAQNTANANNVSVTTGNQTSNTSSTSGVRSTIKATYFSTVNTLGLTWNRKPNDPGYGYFFVGVKTWNLNTSTTTNSITRDNSSFAYGPVIGIRGIKSKKLGHHVSFLYYGSLIFGFTQLSDVKINNVSVLNGINSWQWSSVTLSAEQGIGLGFDTIGITVLLIGRSDLSVGYNPNPTIYSLAWPLSANITLSKLFSF